MPPVTGQAVGVGLRWIETRFRKVSQIIEEPIREENADTCA